MEYDDYDDPEEEAEDVDLSSGLTTDLALDDKELDFEENFSEVALIDQLAKKAKNQGGRFSLKARRAIEDHLEQRRLQKETDYLFDDHFAEEKDLGSKES